MEESLEDGLNGVLNVPVGEDGELNLMVMQQRIMGVSKAEMERLK